MDEGLAARPSVRNGGPDAIFSAAHIAELGYAIKGEAADGLVKGLEIIAPAVIDGDPASKVPAETVLEDLEFGHRYWQLRELLYYTYNAPGSIGWSFEGNRVRIHYEDRSLPRQFFIASNNTFLESIRLFEGREDPTEIEGLIRGIPEDSRSPAAGRALELIEEEAAMKLSAYFNLFDPDFDAPLEGHSYRVLMEVNRIMLSKALWHRYHTRVNGSQGAVLADIDELVDSIVKSSDLLDPESARWALTFMSYGKDVRKRREDPVYFSLYRLPPQESVLLLPHHFCTWESLVSLMRLIALRDPDGYLRHFSGPVGSGLTKRLATAFETAGFECQTDVSMRRFGAHLPDIDLVVISHEPTLGFVVLLCEVKSPLPPTWAKDQLRVLQPDSVAKAFGQLDRIGDFIRSDAGADFLRSLLPEKRVAEFEEFAVVGHQIVITSDNAGAFFSDQHCAIIDFRTLGRLLRRCDGDVLYLMTALRQLGESVDKCFRMVEVNVEVGGTQVEYEGVMVERMFDFAQARFRSEGVPQEMAEEMRQHGSKPLDFLRDRETDHTGT